MRRSSRPVVFINPHTLLWLSLFLFISGCATPASRITFPKTPAESETAPPSVPSPITVHFMDVGQGDAIFIDTSDQDVLIDAGRRSAGSKVADYIAQVSDPMVEISWPQTTMPITWGG